MTEVKLYSIPGSHPAAAARAMLEHKGIPYRRVDLPPVASRVLMRLLGFPGNRVPALKIDGRKVQGSRNVSRELDVLKADPPLFPADPERRAAVEEAERWGDEEFQQMARTITWWALKRHKSDQASFLADAGPMARLGMPTRIAVATSGPILRIAIRLNDSTDDTVRSTLASIGPALDKVDRLIAEGVIGGDQPNAADFQIGGECGAAADVRGRSGRDRRPPGGRAGATVVPLVPRPRPRVLPARVARAAAHPRGSLSGRLHRQDFAPADQIGSRCTPSRWSGPWSGPLTSCGTRFLIIPVSPAGSAACRSIGSSRPRASSGTFAAQTA